VRYRAELAAGVVALGLAVRIVALPLPGASDAPVFALWADTGASEGVGRIYGTGGVFPERRLLARDGVRTKVNYPPLVLYEFAAARALRLPLKTLSVAADAALTLVLWLAVRARSLGPRGEWTVTLGYWLNPAAVLTGSVLGYVEPLMALPATASVVAAAAGWPVLSGALLAGGVLTKQLAVLVAPATLLALAGATSAPSSAARVVRFAAGAGLTAVVICAQVVWSGGALNMTWSLAASLRDPFLSGDAANLWWLIGLTHVSLPLDALRAVGAVATFAAVAWSIAAASRGADLWLSAAAGGFAIHAYAVLAVSVHEPHLLPAVPLLALAAAGRRRFLPPFLMVSGIAALNVPRTLSGPAMALLAIANCLALAWHARVYARECRVAHLSDRGRSPRALPECPSPPAGR
jgi:hypothetical protein